MYQIEKNIPLPAIVRRVNPYPFAEMEVNDSFFVPTTPAADASQEAQEAANKAAKALYNRLTRAKGEHGKALNRKFTIRNVDGGIRVWRTA